MRWLRFALALLALASCGRGDARTGERCRSDRECARGLCVAGVAGERGACTVSCGGDDECPEGWSCTGVTQANVVVCSRGSATPFGH
ncbi:MAG: hypothetical protein J0L92_16410 [Deltaproteobacteria bacterium]|nr:hypothetical protein [Deltaproteobacteria bacterium]